jgi:polygalacturonase
VHLIRMENVADASIEGIILLDTITWNVLLSSCDRVRVGDVKIMARGTYSDGVNPVDSRHVTIDGCFVRNEDDCFSIKLRHKDTKTPIGGCRDITIQNCLLWSDKGRSFLIGPESSGSGPREYADIAFRNVDILKVRNYDAGDWARGALAINCGDGSTVKNLLIEDVRVEGQENGNLINFRIVKTEFNLDAGSRIENVTVRNVTLAGKNAVDNAIVGLDADRCIDGVRFQNLSIDGKVIRSAAEGGFTIRNAKNVTFEP